MALSLLNGYPIGYFYLILFKFKAGLHFLASSGSQILQIPIMTGPATKIDHSRHYSLTSPMTNCVIFYFQSLNPFCVNVESREVLSRLQLQVNIFLSLVHTTLRRPATDGCISVANRGNFLFLQLLQSTVTVASTRN